jgi:hypothetical protein
VGIDEAGHDDAAGSVDLLGIAGAGEVLQAAGWTYFDYDAVADEDGAI